nr:MAG TPA: hypothetical protein [Caudoviricetes sp.]
MVGGLWEMSKKKNKENDIEIEEIGGACRFII